jgi:hypothetical protein
VKEAGLTAPLSAGFKVYHRQFSCNRAKLIIENYIYINTMALQRPHLRLATGLLQSRIIRNAVCALFLDTYFKHYNTRLDTHTTLKFYCDNSSLLKRITCNQNRSWINPTTCLASGFDLESGIIALLIDLPITLQFIHVKSHQDDNTEVHLLTWDAQMNKQANHLANQLLG